MKDDHLEDLRQTIDEHAIDIIESGNNRLNSVREFLNGYHAKLINKHTVSSKDISVTSATVASFSLLALQVQGSLEVNESLLFAGFIILLLNVLVTQFLLYKITLEDDQRYRRSFVDYLLARGKLESASRADVNYKAKEIFDYIKYERELNKFVSDEALNIENQKLFFAVRQYSQAGQVLFATGLSLIILSVLLAFF